MKGTFYLAKVSFEKSIKELKRYKFETLSMVFSFYLLFIAMFLGVNGFGKSLGVEQSNMSGTLEGFVAGYFLWTVMVVAFFEITNSVISDANKGTLEQISMSNMGVHKVLIVRSIVNLILNILLCSIVLVSIMYTTGYWLNMHVLDVIVIILLGIFSMLGISLMFAGLALIHKRVQSFLNIIQYFIIAFVLPANGFFGEMGKTLIPFRPSIEKFYEITLGNKSLLDFPITDYLLIVVNSAVYFSLGLLVFNICSKKAKKKGLLGQY